MSSDLSVGDTKNKRKYVIYENDLKFKNMRNLDPSKIKWSLDKLETMYYNENLDSIEYRFRECEKNDFYFLDLSRLNLKNIPIIPINIIKSIKYLFLNDNNIEQIDLNNEYVNLEALDINNNKINLLQNLPNNLIELCCKCNNINDIPYINNLKILDCSSNKLNNIKNYSNLEILICSDNNILDIPLYKNIKKLICKNNKITVIKSYLDLEYLDCSYNDIIKINNCPNIRDLLCRNTKLTTIPLKLNNLQYLEIYENKFEILEFYPNLKELYCDIDGVNKISDKYIVNDSKMYDNKYLIIIFN